VKYGTITLKRDVTKCKCGKKEQSLFFFINMSRTAECQERKTKEKRNLKEYDRAWSVKAIE